MPKAVGKELTEKERQVLQLVVQGHTNRTMAGKLALSENTIEFHLKSIYTKLDVPNRTAAAIKAVREGLVETTRDSEDYGNQ